MDKDLVVVVVLILICSFVVSLSGAGSGTRPVSLLYISLFYFSLVPESHDPPSFPQRTIGRSRETIIKVMDDYKQQREEAKRYKRDKYFEMKWLKEEYVMNMAKFEEDLKKNT